MAVQTTYGALLPPDLHSSSDMSIALALSDTNMASSFETTSMADYTCDSSPNARAGEHLLFGNFDEDDQVSLPIPMPVIVGSRCSLYCTLALTSAPCHVHVTFAIWLECFK